MKKIRSLFHPFLSRPFPPTYRRSLPPPFFPPPPPNSDSSSLCRLPLPSPPSKSQRTLALFRRRILLRPPIPSTKQKCPVTRRCRKLIPEKLRFYFALCKSPKPWRIPSSPHLQCLTLAYSHYKATVGVASDVQAIQKFAIKILKLGWKKTLADMIDSSPTPTTPVPALPSVDDDKFLNIIVHVNSRFDCLEKMIDQKKMTPNPYCRYAPHRFPVSSSHGAAVSSSIASGGVVSDPAAGDESDSNFVSESSD